jgi:hypothetical protein
MEWHRNLPDGTERDVLDIIAKVLMIRAGGDVTITQDEMREAGAQQAEFCPQDDGALGFRIERQ